ncbi:MAG: hypothetical protein OHK005_17840 [Candidatus Methylacidiphilales bacterium]
MKLLSYLAGLVFITLPVQAQNIFPQPTVSLPHRTYIYVNLTEQRLEFVDNGRVTLAMPISSGRDEKPTPPGRYTVSHKHEKWTSTIYHVSMPYFLRFNGGTIGLHAGPLSGYPGSAGCIRLPEDGARELFRRTRVGTPVLVEGRAPLLEEVLTELKQERVRRGPSPSRGPIGRIQRLGGG